MIQRDFDEYEKKKKEAEETTTSTSVEKIADGTVTTTTTTTTTTKVETIVVNKTAPTTLKVDSPSDPAPDKHPSVDVSVETEAPIGTITPAAPNIDSNTPPDSTSVVNEVLHTRENARRVCDSGDDSPETKKEEEEKGKVTIPHDDPNSIYVGLRVYTHKDVPAVVIGRLKVAKEVKLESKNTSSTSS